MNALALVLVLAAACAHAGWNLASKRAGTSGVPFVWLACLGTVLLLTPFSVGAMIRYESGLLPWLVAGGVSGIIHTAYFSTLQRGYAVGDISVVYPLARGTGPMLSVVLAMIILDERPGWLGLLGAMIIIAGVLLIALSSRGHGTHQGGSAVTGVVFGLVTGVLIAAYTLWDAHAVTTVNVYPVAMMWMSSATQAILLAPVGLRHRDRLKTIWRQHHWEVATVAVLSPVAYILVLFAMRLAPVSLVAPVREVSVVLVSLIGSVLFHEPAFRRRLIGAVVVLAGVTFLALS